ncbi:46 kDa FK506-binding nuclear protein-like [Dermatophagoides pteronyssinus]|uniref:46 kDa FK506-binding nuclear protein-like n=1 Tax=Dermatophagoides pteronyssinus TaxID=6956 RepID=UPI003F67448F
MFWGVTILPGRRYSQTVEMSYHISKAALEIDLKKPETEQRVQVMMEQNKTKYLLCTLDSQKIIQTELDLIFTEGEEVTFFLNGEGTVHLTGYIMDFDDDDEFDDEEDEDEEEEVVEMGKRKLLGNNSAVKKTKTNTNGIDEAEADEEDDDDDDALGKIDADMFDDDDDDDEEDDDEEDDEDDEDDDEEDEDVAKSPVKSAGNKIEPAKANGQMKMSQMNAKGPNQQKQQQQKSNQQQQNNQKPKFGTPNYQKQGGQQQQQKGGQQQNSGQKFQNFHNQKQGGGGNKFQNQKKGPWTPGGQKTDWKPLSGGVKITDLHEGHGPVVKKGKYVHIKYVGKLPENNQEFDRSGGGKPFSFRLGQGEVVKGLEIGVEGMKVGGKRSIMIPPNMGYGKRQMGPIPANATLNFDVELVAVT